MGRFLIYFSYLGTRYSGVQQQAGVLTKGNPVKTIGGALQEALKGLKPANDIKITLSSRTDRGVHALKNACHVDLVYPRAGKEYHPAVVTQVMNRHLMQQGEDVRILQTQLVSDTFNARMHACGRKYVYRLGHTPSVTSSYSGFTSESESFLEQIKRFSARKRPTSSPVIREPLDILDSSKAVIYWTKLDINKLISAAEMLSGIHNFLSFTSNRKPDADHLPHPVKMLAIGVKRGQPFSHRLQQCQSHKYENIEFWDIHVQSKSFLYRQIRRLVGAMVLVARDIISFHDLQDLLENPEKEFPFLSRIVASEDGLFLLDVEYNPKDLELAQSTDVLCDQHIIEPLLHSTSILPSLETKTFDERVSEPRPQHSATNIEDREDDTDVGGDDADGRGGDTDRRDIFCEDNDSIVSGDELSPANYKSTDCPKKISKSS